MSNSYSSKSNIKVSANNRKPFCKVCQDSGKSESEYTSHYTRSSTEKNSVVVCPTLLSMECKYCYKSGHTVKYCPTLEANNKILNKSNKMKDFQEKKKQKEQEAKPVEVKKNKKVNAYSVLDFDGSDSEEEEVSTNVVVPEEVILEEYPALCSPPTKTSQMAFSYASMAAKTVDDYEREKYEKQLIAKSKKNIIKPSKSSETKIYSAKIVPLEFEDDDQEFIDRAYEEARQKVLEEQRNNNEPRIVLKASEIDWTAVDSESDDDW
jgi:Nanos RNA binding domain